MIRTGGGGRSFVHVTGWWLGAAVARTRGLLACPRRAWRRLTGPKKPVARRSKRRSGEVRSDAFAAARVASTEGLIAMARTLSDPDPHVRMRALEVVCEFSNERAERFLIGMLHDPDPTVRRASAAAAARVGAPGVVFSLIHAFEDPIEDVRAAAVDAFVAITGLQVELGALDDPLRRRKETQRLILWWKARRVAQIAAAGRRDGSGNEQGDVR
jgi:HEAT repeat protein